MTNPRKPMPVKVLSINVMIGEASVQISYHGPDQIIFTPTNLRPAYGAIDIARTMNAEHWDFWLAHQIIYYASRGREAPTAGDFDYGFFFVDGHELIMLAKAIRILVEIGEGNTHQGPMVIGSGRN